MRPLVLLLLLALTPALARADDPKADDEPLARQEFAAGAEAYARVDYEEALLRFTAAQRAHPAPELDYNIGRCLDLLNRLQEAIDAYERFLTSRPDSPTAVAVRERVALLRARLLSVEPGRVSTPPAPPAAGRPRLRLAAGLVLGGALVLAVAGGGVYGAGYSKFSERRDECGGQCAPGTSEGLASYVRTTQITSGVLWGVAGMALVADVVLWVFDARARARDREYRADELGVVSF